MNKEQRLNKLTSEYDELCGRTNRLNDFINSIHFEDVVEDAKEQTLMIDQYLAMCRYRANLKARIRILRDQIKRDREMPPIQTQHDPNFDDVDTEQKAMAMHHCGQDADMDDACCQAREKRPVGDDSAAVEEPIITGDSLKELVGWQIVSVMPPKWKCQGCIFDSEESRCEKKVELVGGYFLCLAPLPNSIVTE